ncbi:MAG: hypothetical protein HY696_10740 [Deltaproteobacteria bacterium]|nr:hypothetical protein [Deltaproteobacteria bacterium]
MAGPALLTFRRDVLNARGTMPTATFTDPATTETDPDRLYPIATTGINIRTLLRDLQAGRPLAIPPQFGDLQAVIHDTWIKRGIDADGRPETTEGLLFRTITIPRTDGPARRIELLLVVPMAADGSVSPDQMKRASVIDAGFDAGSRFLIGGIGVTEPDDGTATVFQYTAYNAATKQYESRMAWATNEPTGVGGDVAHSTRLIYSMALCADAFREAVDATTVANRIDERLAPEQPLLEQSEAKVWSDLLRPLYGTLETLRADARWTSAMAAHDPRALDLLRAFSVRADNDLRLSDTDRAARLARHTAIEERFNARMKDFRWNGTFLNRGEVFKQLRAEKDPAQREALYRHFLTHYGALYREPDHLFASADYLNAITAKYGLGNYADVVYRDRFGYDAKEFFALAERYFKDSEPEARAYVAMLQQAQRKLNPTAGETVMIHDVEFLDETWTQQFGGVTTEPRLTAPQALAAVKAFYAELGIDLDAAPWNGIVLDAAKRPNKQGTLGEALPADKDLSYIIMNLDDRGVSVEELATLIHEYLHGIHFQAAQQRGGEFLVVKDLWGGPQDFPEGAAMALQHLLNHPEIATRILGQYPGFTRPYLEARAKVQRVAEVWQTRRLFMIAMQEILLYRDRRDDGTAWPLEERLGMWNRWVREVLFVEPPPGLLYGEWAAKPHLSSKDYYLYYGGYPAGTIRAERVVAKYVRSGTTAELRALREPLLALLRKGSMITSDDIRRAGE